MAIFSHYEKGLQALTVTWKSKTIFIFNQNFNTYPSQAFRI